MMEGVKCPEGKLTESTAFVYLKDHLGSVKAVVDAKSGEVVESSDYSSYGERSLIGPAEYGSERNGATLRAHFTGKEDQMRDFGVDYTDFGARFYSPRVRRWLTPDPLSKKYYGTSPYAYCNGDPINFVDPDGRDSVYVIDSSVRPNDNGNKGETYTAIVFVEINGEISGPYRGSSYPNSISNDNNGTTWNTLNEGAHPFNNKSGHGKGKQYGLNIVDENGNRIAQGTTANGESVEMTVVDIHAGFSDLGNYNSRGSQGCITIHPQDADEFFSHFKWDNNKRTGSSYGTIFVYRTNTEMKRKILNYIMGGSL